MKGIPLAYIWRNLMTRRLTTGLTAGGMALVVFVFTTVLMLEAGLRDTLVDTGSPDNVVVIRAGSQTEVQSSIERTQVSILESLPQIASDDAGRPLFSRECLVLISLHKQDGRPSNVTVRGTGSTGLALRPQARLLAGRLFRPGSSEIVVGRGIAKGFSGVQIGEKLRFARRDWQVVGIIEAGQTAFNSEIWGDAEQMLQAFRRPVFSSVVFKLNESGAFDALDAAIRNEKRLTVEAKREPRFYADQSEVMAKFIRILGMTLSIIFSVGAIIGATITMYASVASRTREIGTLRALGFRRRGILIAFLLEAQLLGLVGGVVGLAAASTMQFFSVSLVNFQTFAELAFSFRMTPAIAVNGLIFALAMGFLGGFLPAIRAARLKVVDALRAV